MVLKENYILPIYYKEFIIVSFHRKNMSDITLKEITEINKRMRLALYESQQLYRISLNAMFASRKINVGVEGFIEVTGLLRDFKTAPPG